MKKSLYKIIIIWSNEEVQTEYETSDNLLSLVYDMEMLTARQQDIEELFVFEQPNADPEATGKQYLHYSRGGF